MSAALNSDAGRFNRTPPRSMSHQPRVSVCVPSYNHARYLPDTIESVLGQTYRDFEVVVVDDGSTDDSLAIAESYAARHPDRVRVFTHPGRRNLGISETVNLAARLSRGEF
jgi:glycosyltransferase involved in cell wall biosynthesis